MQDEINELKSLVSTKIWTLENENKALRTELTAANAKLEVYERILNFSDSKISLGFDSTTKIQEEN